MMRKLVKKPKFWLVSYLVFHGVLFFIFSFPIIKPFQQLWTSAFLVGTLVSAIFLPGRWLILPLLASAILVNPIFTLSVVGWSFQYKLLAGLGVALLVFLKRKEQLSLILILLICNIILLPLRLYRVFEMDKQFREQLHPTTEVNRLHMQTDTALVAGKNVYVILLDGYPDPQILKDSFRYESKLLSSLNGFQWEPSFTRYYRTPVSFLNIFAGYEMTGESYPRYQLTNRDFFKQALTTAPLTQKIQRAGYQVSFHTFMLDRSGKKFNLFNPIFIPKYSINGITHRIWRYLALKKKNHSRPVVYRKYHRQLFNKLKISLESPNKKFQVFHFLTFHSELNSIQEEAAYADSVGLKAIQLIGQKDPTAAVIIMSDHGERRLLKNKENFNRGIYGIKF